MPVRRGSSLIELMVVAAIVAVLAAVLLPAARAVRGSAQRAQCLSNLRQIGVAMQTYLSDNRGWYPTSRQEGVPGAYGSYRHWFEQFQDGLDGTDRDRNGSLDRRDLAAGGRNVIRDCPTRTASANVAFHGYGMNGCLLMPRRPHRNQWIPSSGYYVDYREAQVDQRQDRILVGDSPDWHITVDNPKYPTQWAPNRHGAVANYLFCDLHVAGLAPAAAELAGSDPARLR